MFPISLSQLINGQERAYPCLSHTFQNTSHCTPPPMGKGGRCFVMGWLPKLRGGGGGGGGAVADSAWFHPTPLKPPIQKLLAAMHLQI